MTLRCCIDSWNPPTPIGRFKGRVIRDVSHRQLQDLGRQAVFVDTDTADAKALEQRMTQAADLGTFRVLVNKPGRWLLSPQYPEGRKWWRSVDLNVVMPMLAAQLAVPHLT
jgi:hypothetical protein